MAASVFLINILCRPRPLDVYRGLLFIPTSLAFLTSVFIFYYISSTSRLMVHLHDNHPPVKSIVGASVIKPRDDLPTKPIIQISLPKPNRSSVLETQASNNVSVKFGGGDGDGDDHESPDPLKMGNDQGNQISNVPVKVGGDHDEAPDPLKNGIEGNQSQLPKEVPVGSTGLDSGKNTNKDHEVFHDEDIFLENYKEMNKTLKIYVYPHKPNDPYANVLLPVSYEPGGNYASESYFKKALMKSHFITKNPSKADFFFLPFSIASMRHDKRIGVGGIKDFVRDYIFEIRHKYPFWNRSGGADHFYVACHSIGKIAMEKAVEVKENAIQVVCSSNYFVNGYVAHKDVSLPQIWPRQGVPPQVKPSQRKKLAFFAGANNSPVRNFLVQSWQNDPDIFAHAGRLRTPYSTQLLTHKFCLHVKGFEVNTARIGDALYYGCVPVILADHYDLPFEDILNWKSFSVVVATEDVPSLKRILKGVEGEEYLRLLRNVGKVRRHFQWHGEPLEYDAFHMVMYELWLRRSFVRVPM